MTPLAIHVLHGATAERLDEIDTMLTARAVTDALRRLGHGAELVHLGPDFGALRRLAAIPPDIVFNLVEAVGGDAVLAAEVPAELERLGIPFTGCGARASYSCLSKPGMKRLLRAAGLPTPAWSLSGADFGGVAQVIVKSAVEHASFGMDAGSVVPGGAASREIARRRARFGGDFFAEAYIPGREFNISVLDGATGPEVLPPAEILFLGFGSGAPEIVDYDAKWVEGSHGYENTPRRFDFPAADRELLTRLADFSLGAWHRFGLSGYARVDFRVDAEGRPWILEVNTNPCLAPDAGFVAAANRAGLGYDALVARIVAAVPAPARKAA